MNSKPMMLVDIIDKTYPWNLAMAVFGDKDMVMRVYAPGIIESLSLLAEREAKVLRLRYRDGLTLEKTGKEFNVTRERIRQVEAKAIRKLRHPSISRTWIMVEYEEHLGLRRERDRLAEECEELRKQLALMPDSDPIPEQIENVDVGIEDLELSVRSYNCLKRAGINTIGDLRGTTRERLMKVRNLGRKSMEEVITMAKEWGIEIE